MVTINQGKSGYCIENGASEIYYASNFQDLIKVLDNLLTDGKAPKVGRPRGRKNKPAEQGNANTEI